MLILVVRATALRAAPRAVKPLAIIFMPLYPPLLGGREGEGEREKGRKGEREWGEKERANSCFQGKYCHTVNPKIFVLQIFERKIWLH